MNVIYVANLNPLVVSQIFGQTWFTFVPFLPIYLSCSFPVKICSQFVALHLERLGMQYDSLKIFVLCTYLALQSNASQTLESRLISSVEKGGNSCLRINYCKYFCLQLHLQVIPLKSIGNILSSKVKQFEMSYRIQPKAGKHYRMLYDFFVVMPSIIKKPHLK